MLVTSPSALVLNDDCERAYDLKYERRLVRREEKRSPTMASGTALHFIVERRCHDWQGVVPSGADIQALAEDVLEREFAGDYDGGKKNVKKFLPGVVRAAGRVPEWVWLGDWRTEEWLEADFPSPHWPYVEPWVRLRGVPDLWRFVEGETPGIEIVDVKTTDADQMDFVLWTPQIRMYAAMLAQRYPGRLVSYRYLCVPTSANKAVPTSVPFVMTATALARAEAEIVMYATKLVESQARPRYSRRCSWCTFAPVCTAIISGADPAGITDELFMERPLPENETWLDTPTEV